MTFIGADVGGLITMAQQFRASGEQLNRIGPEMTAACRRSTWLGPDADDFTGQWDGVLVARIKATGDALLAAASDVLKQAIQQDQASGGFDPARYGDLLAGQDWSDIINWVQDRLPGDDATAETFGGYVKGVDPATVPVDGPGAAFGNIDNMNQGAIGDCWLMSALAAVGQRDPAFLDQHINFNAQSGKWEVTLYQDGKPVVVEVSPDQLVAQGARDAGGNISWMSVYEQAVAQHLGGYENLIADTPAAGLELITGRPVDQQVLGTPNLDDLDQAIKDGKPITAMSDPIKPLRGDVAAAHVYVVESVDVSAGTITVVNPWGPSSFPNSGGYTDRVTLTLAQYQYNFIMTGVGATK